MGYKKNEGNALSYEDMSAPPLPATAPSPYAPGTQGNRTPAPAAAAPAAPTYQQQMESLWPSFFAPKEQISAAMQSMLPAYQARLGGLTSPVTEGMRNKSQQAIQAQYGNALRSASNIASAQGVRGAAAAAMQNDIRNQMGQATANFERDLNIANWDAQRQALMDYYGAATGQGGGILGTLAGMQQLQNTNAGYAAQLAQLRNMLNANQNSGGMLPYPSWLPQQLNPNTSPLSPIKYING